MAGGYPCCCLPDGSSQEGSSAGGGGSGGSSDSVIFRGSSYIGTAQCLSFENALSPVVLRVEVSGITSKTCSDCALLNGVYFTPASVLNHPTRCAWQLSFPPVCGHYSLIYVELFAPNVGDYTWSVLLSDRPFVQSQELILIADEQLLPGQITIDDVDDILLQTASELNATRCAGNNSATARVSAVA
ncbi:MAG: hypothetical protein MPJ50_01915 [Pirellulales bacterium]|nr:hypothetical protein [Pirellulales bacterium]